MIFKGNTNPQGEMSFLQHLEALRWHLVRSVIAVLIAGIVLFINNDLVFDKIIIPPKQADFWTYRMLCLLSEKLLMGDLLCIKEIPFELINTTLSGQFTLHMWISFVGGAIIAFPYILWEFWTFLRPALKDTEKKNTRGIVFFASLLFLTGVLFAYFVIVPLSVHFLGTYQVSNVVKNMIELESYISTVTTLTIATGIVFELPIIVYFLTKIGMLTPAFMRKYRRHAVVVILIVAAVITPSPDITSQLLVAFPLYILYEASIIVSSVVYRSRA